MKLTRNSQRLKIGKLNCGDPDLHPPDFVEPSAHELPRLSRSFPAAPFLTIHTVCVSVSGVGLPTSGVDSEEQRRAKRSSSFSVPALPRRTMLERGDDPWELVPWVEIQPEMLKAAATARLGLREC